MDERRFKAGDVVRLKSGGPDMTVLSFGQYGHGDEMSYKCRWFTKDQLNEDTFTEQELEAGGTGPQFIFNAL